MCRQASLVKGKDVLDSAFVEGARQFLVEGLDFQSGSLYGHVVASSNLAGPFEFLLASFGSAERKQSKSIQAVFGSRNRFCLVAVFVGSVGVIRYSRRNSIPSRKSGCCISGSLGGGRFGR